MTDLQARADADGLITWDVSGDSTVTRANQHAAGARKRTERTARRVPCEPDDHELGRSRGRLTTKPHLTVEQDQKPLSLVVLARQKGDSPRFRPVLEGIRAPPTVAVRGAARSGAGR